MGWSAHCSVLLCQRVWQALEWPWLGKSFLRLYTWDFQRLSKKVCIQTLPFPNIEVALSSPLRKGAEQLKSWNFSMVSAAARSAPDHTGFDAEIFPFLILIGALWSCPLHSPGWNGCWPYSVRPRNFYKISKTDLKAFVWKLLKTKFPFLSSSTSRFPSDKT